MTNPDQLPIAQRTDICENCHYWTQPHPDLVKNNTGFCRRYPPVSGEHIIPKQNVMTRQVTPTRMPYQRIPATAHDEWCGEFKLGSRIALS